MSKPAKKRPQHEAPPEYADLCKLFDAYQALKAFGWAEPRYFDFPPDGEEFELIELGSTGIHRAVRRNGHCWVAGNWPSTPCFLRRKPCPKK